MDINRFILKYALAETDVPDVSTGNYAIIFMRESDYIYSSLRRGYAWSCCLDVKSPFVVLRNIENDSGNLKGYLRKLHKDEPNLIIFHHRPDNSTVLINNDRLVMFDTTSFIKKKKYYTFGGVLYGMGCAVKYKQLQEADNAII